MKAPQPAASGFFEVGVLTNEDWVLACLFDWVVAIGLVLVNSCSLLNELNLKIQRVFGFLNC